MEVNSMRPTRTAPVLFCTLLAAALSVAVAARSKQPPAPSDYGQWETLTDLVSNYGNHHWSSGIAETDHIETGQQRMEVPLYEDLQAYSGIPRSSTCRI